MKDFTNIQKWLVLLPLIDVFNSENALYKYFNELNKKDTGQIPTIKIILKIVFVLNVMFS